MSQTVDITLFQVTSGPGSDWTFEVGAMILPANEVQPVPQLVLYDGPNCTGSQIFSTDMSSSGNAQYNYYKSDRCPQYEPKSAKVTARFAVITEIDECGNPPIT